MNGNSLKLTLEFSLSVRPLFVNYSFIEQLKEILKVISRDTLSVEINSFLFKRESVFLMRVSLGQLHLAPPTILIGLLRQFRFIRIRK